MKYYSIKQFLNDSFQIKGFLESAHVVMRPYDPNTEFIISNFSINDWNMIFPNVDETIFKEFAEIDDRLILSCFEKGDSHPFGFLIIIESEDSKDKIVFHGGTWKHECKYTLFAYEGLYKAIHFLVNKGFVILTSCHRNNTKADLLQKHFGFVEYKTDDILSYKYLNVSKFNSSDIPGRLELCFSHLSK